MKPKGIKEIIYSPEEVDVLLIQPPVMQAMSDSAWKENFKVFNLYLNTLDKVGKLLGDQPTEANVGLLSIASYLKSSGYLVSLLDFNMLDHVLRTQEDKFVTEDDIEKALRLKSAKIIGISYMTSTYGLWGKKIAKICKKVDPDALLVFGGIHPTIKSEETMKECKEVDLIVCGEAEFAMKELTDRILNKKEFRDIPGITYRKGGNIIRSEYVLHLTEEELNSLPPPAYAYDLLPKESFVPSLVPRIYTARGCQGGYCSFCVVSAFFRNQLPPMRKRRIADVIEEIKYLKNKFKPEYFVIGDLCFFSDSKHGEEFCEEVKSLDIKWWCQTRVDLITSERARLMKDAGCIQVAVGCEGASQEQLNLVYKGIRPDISRRACEIIKSVGLIVQTYWIIGLPKENRKSVKMTIDMIKEFISKGLADVTHISVLVPYPGTILYEQPEKFGIELIEPKKYEKYWMNCDRFGAGIPVYRTLSKNSSGLTEYEIYSFWEESLKVAAYLFEEKSKSGPNIAFSAIPIEINKKEVVLL